MKLPHGVVIGLGMCCVLACSADDVGNTATVDTQNSDSADSTDAQFVTTTTDSADSSDSGDAPTDGADANDAKDGADSTSKGNVGMDTSDAADSSDNSGSDATDASTGDQDAGGTSGEPVCCAVDADCDGDLICVPNLDCVDESILGPGQCWIDAHCPGGECMGATVCPCNGQCDSPNVVGQCFTPGKPDKCVTVDPASFGDCDMEIGVVFDGNACVMASGCDCGSQCGYVFESVETCESVCKLTDKCKDFVAPGCVQSGCEESQTCDTNTGDCVPSSCSCDAATGKVICTADCGGGVCVDKSEEQCCSKTSDCKSGEVCVADAGICKKSSALSKGECWNDSNCGTGSCKGAKVCPCGANCNPDMPGKCSGVAVNPLPGACCDKNKPCGILECNPDALVCVKPAPSGKCWTGADCPKGAECTGGFLCGCNDKCEQKNALGTCSKPVIEPPANTCCSTDKECPLGTNCALPAGVCKKAATGGYCWDDGDCKPGTTCQMATVCKCGAQCAKPDQIGKCKAPPVAPTCCTKDDDCTGKTQCVLEANVCKPTLASSSIGLCWSDANCKSGYYCSGANVCNCEEDCSSPDKMGLCKQLTSPGQCCKSDDECSDTEICVTDPGVCKTKVKPGSGYCWSDADCPTGIFCTLLPICPCDQTCELPNLPGKCKPGGVPGISICKPIKPNSFGSCDKELGWVFDGKGCVLASGCSCDPMCSLVYATEAECKTKCLAMEK